MRSDSRAPLVRVLADGAVVPGVVEVDVWSNGYPAADRFRIRLAAAAGGLAAVDVQGVRLDVQVGVDGDWTSLVVGEADDVRFDVTQGLVDVDGRDLSALMIDSRVDETFTNRTSSEIAGLIAGRHGLQADVAATGTAVGRYYQSDHERLTMGQLAKIVTEWDLLSALAQREGFVVFMAGETLRFGPVDGPAPVMLTPGDCEGLHMEHRLGLERSIEVTVRSWDQQGAHAVTQTVTGGGQGRTWKHQVTRPNLPADEAQRLAQRVLADLVQHARRVDVTMPGETVISVRGGVMLAGTGTDWDGAYAVGEVNRHLGVRRGFTQRVVLLRAA